MTKSEKVFVMRMVPHVMAGKSFDDAALAVLADDERLELATWSKDDVGNEIRSVLSSVIYKSIRDAEGARPRLLSPV